MTTMESSAVAIVGYFIILGTTEYIKRRWRK